jgi:tRNA dimethylallyltransferase
MSTVETSAKPKVALIAGPTASGKSALAVRLARRLAAVGRRAVVLNADSAQVYSDLQVLSARPTAEEMGGIEHRLFGAWDGATACSAADWAEAARREIERLHAEDAVPILVGGTGLYLRTLLEGIAPVPPIDDDVRKGIRVMSQSEARVALEREDPEAAARLAPRDSARTMRALEVIRSTGRPLAHWQANKRGGIGVAVQLTAAVLLPERQWLFERCDRRFAAMIESGAREEVMDLLARRLDPTLPVMRAIGVREIADWIAGRATRENMLARGQAATRQYAKRQYTWFRHQPPSTWTSLESQSCYDSILDELLCPLVP